MLLNTRFGEIEVMEEKILTFEQGLIGLEKLKKFVIVEYKENSPFRLLQSIENPTVTFLVVNIFDFFPNYTIELPDTDINDLNINNEKDLMVLAIVTIASKDKCITANLQGPVIINLKNCKGKQVVIASGDYTTKHNLNLAVKKDITGGPKDVGTNTQIK